MKQDDTTSWIKWVKSIGGNVCLQGCKSSSSKDVKCKTSASHTVTQYAHYSAAKQTASAFISPTDRYFLHHYSWSFDWLAGDE